MKYFVVYLWNFVFLWIFLITPLWRIGRFYFRDPKKWSKLELDIKYVGFEIENRFVVGYGLDYDGLGRNLKDIYQLCS